jgi:hypothetical protein
MTWIDEARLERAKLKAEVEANAEANRAQAARERAANEAKQKDLFARGIKELLPLGVELVSVFVHYPEPGVRVTGERVNGGPNPGGRVHVGDGVQFDLVCSSRVDSSRYFDVPITAYEAGSDLSSANRLASRPHEEALDSFTRYGWGKSVMSQLLLEALEKHDAKRASA